MIDRSDIKILVGCEFTGGNRDAFLALGYDAWSCDLLPSPDGSNRHIQDDIREVMQGDWDLMMVAHPPCTRLCNSGVRWLHRPPRDRTLDDMWRELEDGAQLFSDIWNADIEHIAIENPIMHKYAKERIDGYVDPVIVQPHWFGDPAFKATGWYLRELPPLRRTHKMNIPAKGTDEYKRWSAVHYASPGPDRWIERSKPFPGMSRALASQWGEHVYRRLTA